MNWISVKDRLPDKETLVLIYAYEEDGSGGEIYTAEYCDWNPNQVWHSNAGSYDDWITFNDRQVTHWMPLPNPPESVND